MKTAPSPSSGTVEASSDLEARGGTVEERRILLLAPTGNDARLTSGFLTEGGFTVEVCRDMGEVCRRLGEGCGAVLLAEETLGPQSVTALLEALKQQPSWSDVPVTIITGGSEAVRQRLRRLATSGLTSNVGLLERPFHPETLLSMVDVAWRARRRQYQVRDLLHTQKASELRLQGILESINDAFAVLDKNWCFNYLNQSYMKLVEPLYREPQELLGENVWEKFPDIRNLPIGDFYRRSMAEQKPGSMELFYAPVNRWLEVHANPSPEILSIYIRDITERKQQEEALAGLTREIGNQARLFDATLSHMADLAYTFDQDGRVVYANKPMLDVWGRTLEEVVGKTVIDLGYPGELGARVHGQLKEVVAGGKPIKDEANFTSASGMVDFHEYIFNPVFDADGKVVAVAGTTRLITERKVHEAALKHAKEMAEAANRSKDRFLAVLSHELRTPLTPVLMTVSALEMDPDLPPAVKNDMAMVRRNVELETKLIDDLLDISRITSGKLVLRPEPVDLNDLVRQVCAICRSEILEKGLRLECRLEDMKGEVTADPARLQQVLWNVIKNAVKFTPHNGAIYVSTARTADGLAEVQVRDTGKGISAEVLPWIFDAFEQGDARVTRQFGGLGLGLAIAKALVELHRGTIAAESPGAGEGTCITITLPLEVQKPVVERAPSDAEPRPSPEQLRLLVVEDHADTARTLGLLLRRAGFLVTTAENVTAALSLAAAQSFDVMVSDVGLPDGTGCELMKKISDRYKIPGIAMSGYGLEEDIAKSAAAGFSEHLVKPVRVAQLEQAIRRVVARR